MSSESSPRNTDRVLVTGATSFLGVSLVKRLLEDGGEVHLVVRPGSERGRLSTLSRSLIFHEHDATTENFMQIVADVTPSTVFHLATQYSREHSPDQLDGLVQGNILFGLQLLEAMQASGVRRLINLGTYFQYFDAPGYRPANLYAATKQAFEDILRFYQDAHQIDATTLILYDVYGPGDWRPKLMGAIRDALDNDIVLQLVAADTVLDLVFVDDVVDALLFAAREAVGEGPFAVSGPQRATLKDVVNIFETVAETEIEAEYGVYPTPERSPRAPWTGPSLPGWQPRVGLEEGIRRFLAEGR